MRPAIFLLPLLVAAAAPLAAAEVVSVPEFRSVQLHGGGSVAIRPGASQRVTILEGNTQVTRFRVNGGDLHIDACRDCPRNYRLRIEIESPRLPDVAVTGGRAITATPGFRPQAQLSVAVIGGGHIDVRPVTANQVSAAINGGGRILTGQSSRLSAAVNGGGEIRYAGTPRVSSVVNGGGRVRAGE